jgi:tetratricopeptide (TPR) repeat protein
MDDLALLYRHQVQYDRAESRFLKALEIGRRALGEGNPKTLILMSNLAGFYWTARKLDRSVPLFEEVLKRRQAELGPDHPKTLLTMANLGVNYRDAGRLPEGTALLEQAWAMVRKRPVPLARDGFIPTALAQTYDQAGQFAKAEPLYREALETARKQHGKASLPVVRILDSLGLNLLKQRKYAAAEPVLRECVMSGERIGPDNWARFNAESMLGGSLLGQEKYAEAERLLLAGYEGMKQREAKIAAQSKLRLTEAIERLVQLYEAWGEPEKAAVWRARLGRTDLPADVFARP